MGIRPPQRYPDAAPYLSQATLQRGDLGLRILEAGGLPCTALGVPHLQLCLQGHLTGKPCPLFLQQPHLYSNSNSNLCWTNTMTD